MPSLLLVLLASMCFGCGPGVSIAASRHPAFVGTIEPVAFVIFQGNTGSLYTEPLQEALALELKSYGIPASAHIITGAEFDVDAEIDRIAAQARGVVMIVPVGGTSYYGALKQILYDVSAYAKTDANEGLKVWHAQIDTGSGAYEVQIKARLGLFAKRLVERLVADELLRATRTPGPAAQGQTVRPARNPHRKSSQP